LILSLSAICGASPCLQRYCDAYKQLAAGVACRLRVCWWFPEQRALTRAHSVGSRLVVPAHKTRWAGTKDAIQRDGALTWALTRLNISCLAAPLGETDFPTARQISLANSRLVSTNTYQNSSRS
jgi:hypothetical protein